MKSLIGMVAATLAFFAGVHALLPYPELDLLPTMQAAGWIFANHPVRAVMADLWFLIWLTLMFGLVGLFVSDFRARLAEELSKTSPLQIVDKKD